MIPRETINGIVERVATEDRGRLVAFLSSRYGDLALAEDALSKAFLSALAAWPESGVPAHPQAWLLTTARNSILDEFRRQAVRDRLRFEPSGPEPETLPDKRLELLFVCAHPAIDCAVHTPLMLQAVFRLDTARIAAAFVVAPDAMAQRLCRAKQKIAAARIPFQIPAAEELPQRLQAVLEAVYAAYSAGWDDWNTGRCDLAEEAIWLTRVLVFLLPNEPEARGLLALLLHAEARKGARRTKAGDFVPLADQDCALWSRELQREADCELLHAHRLGSQLGPFQLEAAIQSAHASRANGNATPWRAIAALYDALVEIRPSLGAVVGRAAAHAEAFGAERGLQALDATEPYKNRFAYQSYWACRAKLSRSAGRQSDAADCYRRAIALTREPALRRYLESHLR